MKIKYIIDPELRAHLQLSDYPEYAILAGYNYPGEEHHTWCFLLVGNHPISIDSLKNIYEPA